MYSFCDRLSVSGFILIALMLTDNGFIVMLYRIVLEHNVHFFASQLCTVI